MCDSAIYFLNCNIRLANSHQDGYREASSQIALSYLLSSSGMYMEAVDMLQQVDRKSLDKKALIAYYDACDHVFGEAGFYTQARELGEVYSARSQLYKDSLFTLLKPHSEMYLSRKETAYRDNGELEQALAINNERLLNV